MDTASKARQRRSKREDSGLSAVKTLRKALAVLDAFAAAENPLSVAEVALRAGVTRPTALRLAQTLVAEGYLLQDPRDGRLSPGYSVLSLAGRLLDTNRLRLESLPHLSSMARAAGERASLGILHRKRVIYLAGVEKPSLPTIYTRIGRLAAAHCTAVGKAMLAYLPEPELQGYLDEELLVSSTPNTLSDESALRANLADIRQTGFAIDREELTPGLFGVAAAILVEGVPVAGIGLTGRSLEPLLEHKAVVLHAAEVISHVLNRGSA
jgi:IclR family acetate operon transcriptional repressor